MRFALLLLLLLSSLAARAESVAEIHSERPFGYFVGDLIHAWVDIRASADAELQAASLPSPGPLTISLDLRDVALEPLGDDGGKLWRLHLTYQNFYVSLDVRDIKIPGFALILSHPAGNETLQIPAWSVGVAPLREVTPTKAAEAVDYLRPDGAPPKIDEARPKRVAAILAAATLLAFAAVARDRGWPPFHLRRARRFARLARRLGAQARHACADEEIRAATQSLHRAIDATAGRSILGHDLGAFLIAHPQYAPLEAPLRRFFTASERLFFGGAREKDHDVGGLARLAGALAERERAT
ncbi:nonribosomal peptide synthetase MxaA [Methylosinus sp. Sm6]|uniref:nonribosomal peptide synthetase MxaA n=1 Tax=Methylosinus sp. Sm6 TaxID=2866948 RepID=UPI001C9A235E|nr:nonribosomal peptide synthetase MxaA [Methylosinus sp. Sm6]MBY6240860.1 nonribosomal peptide synthetase MxaA [Methylosinus sp. Sm6]